LHPAHNAPLPPELPQQEQEKMGNESERFWEEWIGLEVVPVVEELQGAVMDDLTIKIQYLH